jgi:predicted HTH transcriptional regulator
MTKDLHAVRGKFYIQRLIDEGEHEHQDFKFAISDVNKIAHSISAFSNNDGGCLLVGVKDNGVVAGIRTEEDIHLVEAAAELYCKPAVALQMQAYRCEAGAVVVKVTIPKAQHRPVKCKEADGTWRTYYRVADENIVAHPLMVRAWQLAEAETESGCMAYSATESALLGALEARGTATVEQLMVDTHLSQASTEDAVARMAAIGLITFQYSHPRFLLAGAQPSH